TRKALFDARVHDWASLVAHIRFPEDMDEQLKDNRLKMRLESMKTTNAWADHTLRYRNVIRPGNNLPVSDHLTSRFGQSIKALTDLFKTDINAGKSRYAEHYGLMGSACKRKSEYLFRMSQFNQDPQDGLMQASLESLKTSGDWYYQGYVKQINHWTAIQYLSITAVIKGTLDKQEDRDVWTVTRILAESDSTEEKDAMTRIWSWGTLAELWLLYLLTLPADLAGHDTDLTSAKEKATLYYDKVAKAKIYFAADVSVKQEEIIFAMESTQKQFERYIHWWPVMMPSPANGLLQEIALDLTTGYQ
ncbi:MAG: hypothetical protein NTW16_04670, partial [Bacteroidetes bacterium]|nr:hypothetical protein [Bacteroidota bacterium]